MSKTLELKLESKKIFWYKTSNLMKCPEMNFKRWVESKVPHIGESTGPPQWTQIEGSKCHEFLKMGSKC